MSEEKTSTEDGKTQPVKSLYDRVIETIKQCYDPEIPVDIYELGLIYEVNVLEGNDIKVLMTLTSPACPVAETLPEEVRQRIEKMPDVNKAEVEITFEPPWDKSMMSEEALLELGMW